MKRRFSFGLVAVLLLLVGLLAGCSAPAAKPVRLQDPEARMPLTAPKSTGFTPFRVAVSSILSPMETLDGYEPLLKYLAARLDRPVVLLQRRTDQEVNQLLQERGVDCRDRKSLYDDLEMLRLYGLDIESRREGRGTHFSRDADD